MELGRDTCQCLLQSWSMGQETFVDSLNSNFEYGHLLLFSAASVKHCPGSTVWAQKPASPSLPQFTNVKKRTEKTDKEKKRKIIQAHYRQFLFPDKIQNTHTHKIHTPHTYRCFSYVCPKAFSTPWALAYEQRPKIRRCCSMRQKEKSGSEFNISFYISLILISLSSLIRSQNLGTRCLKS